MSLSPLMWIAWSWLLFYAIARLKGMPALMSMEGALLVEVCCPIPSFMMLLGLQGQCLTLRILARLTLYMTWFLEQLDPMLRTHLTKMVTGGSLA